jgi:hypothetical protein
MCKRYGRNPVFIDIEKPESYVKLGNVYYHYRCCPENLNIIINPEDMNKDE